MVLCHAFNMMVEGMQSAGCKHSSLPHSATKHFAQEDGLMLLALEADRLGPDLKWEPSRGGALFPHLYRALHLDDIVWSKPLPKVNGTHQFPKDMS